MGCSLHSVSMECIFRRGLLFPSIPTEQIYMKLVSYKSNNGYYIYHACMGTDAYLDIIATSHHW